MDLEYSNLNVDNATEDDLINALRDDYQLYLSMQRKISELEKSREEKKLDDKKDETIFNIGTVEKERLDVDVDFEGEIDYYYSIVKNVNSLDLETDMIDALPSPEHYQYRKILLRISAEIVRNIKFIRELLSDKNVTKEDVEAFSGDIDLELKKIDIIKSLLNTVEMETVKKEVKKNKLIFLPTLNGNIRVIEDFDDIDIEYYDRFYELINSIEDGTFKNVKRFREHKELIGLCEVKDFKTRVLFRRLSRDTYVIIGAFIKKTDSDALYISTVVGYHDLFKKQENWLRENIDNLEFLAAHNSCKDELLTMLQSKKCTSKVLKKGGS